MSFYERARRGSGPVKDLDLALLIYKQGSWGPGGSDARVIEFLDTAFAVMMGESGGDPRADNPTSTAAGLFQIMVSVHSDKIKGRDMFDPVANVDVARDVWVEAGKKWTPWEAYNNKTPVYRANLGHGARMFKFLSLISEQELGQAYAELLANFGSLAAVPLAVSGTPGLLASDQASGIRGMLGDIGEFVKQSGLTIGVFVLGLVLLLVGLVVLFGQSKTAKKAVDTGVKAVL